VTTGYFDSWLAPFPFAVGFFALALFAFLAAVYLTLETNEKDLQEDFRRRALLSGVAVGVLALIVFLLAETGAPTVRAGISRSPWALVLHFLTAVSAVSTFYVLWTRKYKWARVFAAVQVALILLGWALAQFPYLVEPDVTVYSAAAPRITLQLLLSALAAGTGLLFPSYYYLFRIFKSETAFTSLSGKTGKIEK
jgi:cytochrome d ubiquinol oxidase subunit II